MTFTPKTPAFEKAVKDSRNLKAKPDNDELLEVYIPPLGLGPNLPILLHFMAPNTDHENLRRNSSTPSSNKVHKTLPSPKRPSPGCST